MNEVIVSSSSNNSTLITLACIVIPFILFILLAALIPFIMNKIARYKALKKPPIGFQEGMVYDHKAKQIKAVRTPVHLDPESGKRYLGKPIF